MYVLGTDGWGALKSPHHQATWGESAIGRILTASDLDH